MVYADDAQREVVGFRGKFDGNGWLVKRGVDVVNWDWVVWVGGVARNVAHNAQFAVWRSERGLVDEGWNLGREVDAVDKDIGLDDLLVWARLSIGLCHIPFL